MNEEMRKEFEVWADSIGLCQVDLIIDLEKYMDGNVELSWQSWKASRKAMKPIKLPEPTDYLDVNGASACTEYKKYSIIAIQQAGHKVAE